MVRLLLKAGAKRDQRSLPGFEKFTGGFLDFIKGFGLGFNDSVVDFIQ